MDERVFGFFIFGTLCFFLFGITGAVIGALLGMHCPVALFELLK